MARILGLDLGPNSIGWALVDESEASSVATGVRVFPEGLENFDTRKEKSLNEQRRVARGMRRQIRRRARRRLLLRQGLVEAGLLPADPTEQAELMVALTPRVMELMGRLFDAQGRDFPLGPAPGQTPGVPFKSIPPAPAASGLRGAFT